MRAVVEHHHDETTLPPLDVLVAAGKESVTIKVSVGLTPPHVHAAARFCLWDALYDWPTLITCCDTVFTF